jgi:Tol biopolymer transport system component
MRAAHFRFCALLTGAFTGCSDNSTGPPPDDGEPLPQGIVLFVSAQDFDLRQARLERMTIDGSERDAASDFIGAIYHRLALSPDGTSVLFTTVEDPFALLSPSSLARLTLATGVVEVVSDSAWSGSWSADGSQIAFVSAMSGQVNIFVMNADGSDVRPLTDDGNYKGTLDWDRQTGRIVYVNWYDGAPDRSDLWWVPPAGGDVAPLLALPGYRTFCFDPRWSPDGASVVFAGQTSTYGDAGGGIYVADADGSKVRQIVPAGGSFPAWSPNGQWIVFSRSVLYDDPTTPLLDSSQELFLVHPDGTGLRQLTETREIDEVYPIWLE